MKFPEFPKLPKRIWALIVGIVLVGAAILGVGLMRFTTANSYFCLKCHRNEEPVAMWLPSRTHPQKVTCTDCHVKPGTIIPRRFSASDDLMNQNCLYCHSTLPRGEQTALQSVHIVKISHKLHAAQGALCVDCHRNIVHDASSPRTHRPRMETCYLCHQAHPRDQACATCHPINLVYTEKEKTS
jgi:nitrate/TMAO reductase-like tetraheme cytochrome c subunit